MTGVFVVDLPAVVLVAVLLVLAFFLLFACEEAVAACALTGFVAASAGDATFFDPRVAALASAVAVADALALVAFGSAVDDVLEAVMGGSAFAAFASAVDREAGVGAAVARRAALPTGGWLGGFGVAAGA